ncbi:MAG: ATP-dependent exonuclease [Actinobacteria bacterium HGW-Actinobacteria-2]|nr:MAG: ATP-dependent exonuclease [Actinobacteria bacterium HGW-Actinobacteria-2]
MPEVSGWFSFLLNHVVRPYLPDVYPGRSVTGLHWVEGADPARFARGADRYIDPEGRVYSHRLGKLAYDIAIASHGAVVDRLERIFDEIYIDEVQDLTGNDLGVLELMLRSKMNITLVGDVRQSVFSTSRSDTKNKKYQGMNKVEWFREMERKTLCLIEYRTATWRCTQEIIDFADSVVPVRFSLPNTTSHQSVRTGHDGVFVVTWDHVPEYLEKFSPEVLRDKSTSKIHEGCTATNFGQAKGITVERVLIYPTKPIEAFLLTGALLADTSAARLYVAVTRAKHSVAFVVSDSSHHLLPRWTP